MKWKLLLSLAVLLFTTQLASAQSSVNCAALSGTPLMCLKNMSPFVVVGVQANVNPGYGQSWIPIPGGSIPPGGTSIVNFGNWNGKCNMYVAIRTSSGTTHSYPYVNVCSSTSFNIMGW